MQKTILILTFLIVSTGLFAQEEQEKKDFFKIGGALRFNLAWQNYELKNRDSDFYLKTDTWYLTVDASKSNFDVSLQYRFYPDSKIHFLHHAYIGYSIDESWYAKLGVFQKPFGINGSASHSWWSQMPYYMGFEDTYNTGLGFTYDKGKFAIDVAYFRQAAPKGFMSAQGDNSVGNSRYAYAIVPIDSVNSYFGANATIKELDQFNLRFRYRVNSNLELGVSSQLGSIYNRVLDKQTWAFSNAIHAVINYDRFNIKAEAISYNYKAYDDKNNKLDIVQMAAYGSAYDVAAKGQIYTAGVSYKIPINKKFVQQIEAYVDYSWVNKSLDNSFNTHMIIPGLMITSGPILTYIDLAIGKNQPWLTSNFGQGLGFGEKDARWNTRLNINVGYYF